MSNCSHISASVVLFFFFLLENWTYASVLTSSSVFCCFDNGESRKGGRKKAEEGSDEAGVCAPPHLTHTHTLTPLPACTGLTIASHFSLLPANPYYLLCKQRPFYLHTRPAPGAAAAAAAASEVRPTCAPNKGNFLC